MLKLNTPQTLHGFLFCLLYILYGYFLWFFLSIHATVSQFLIIWINHLLDVFWMCPVYSLHSGQTYTCTNNLRLRDKRGRKKSLSWFHRNTAQQNFVDKSLCQQTYFHDKLEWTTSTGIFQQFSILMINLDKNYIWYESNMAPLIRHF